MNVHGPYYRQLKNNGVSVFFLVHDIFTALRPDWWSLDTRDQKHVTLEPRKGHTQVLSAFELLWKQREDVNLAIVGKPGWTVENLIKRLKHHPERAKRLFWLQGISDEYLKKIYTASTCLIAASEGEGFGLPLIEAAQHKLPIIARDLQVFREVAGEHAYYFQGKKSDDLARAVQNWLKHYEQDEHPKSDDMPWLTWEQSAEKLKNILLT
ncbi:MAG: glycosyltransferase [Desulfovermiculus sp.]|nr:glycosyltransferase [Desulfovermiculus sp.]